MDNYVENERQLLVIINILDPVGLAQLFAILGFKRVILAFLLVANCFLFFNVILGRRVVIFDLIQLLLGLLDLSIRLLVFLFTFFQELLGAQMLHIESFFLVDTLFEGDPDYELDIFQTSRRLFIPSVVLL